MKIPAKCLCLYFTQIILPAGYVSLCLFTIMGHIHGCYKLWVSGFQSRVYVYGQVDMKQSWEETIDWPRFSVGRIRSLGTLPYGLAIWTDSIVCDQKHGPNSLAILAQILVMLLTYYLTLCEALILLPLFQSKCFGLDASWNVFNCSCSMMPRQTFHFNYELASAGLRHLTVVWEINWVKVRG